MALKRFTAEGQANGTALSVSNSATGSGDALGVVSKAGAGAAVYSTGQAAHGTKSILTTCTAAADTAIMGFSGMSATSMAGQFYIYITALPTLGTIELAQMRFAGGSATKILLSATSKQLQITDALGGQIKAFANALAVNTLYRVNLRATIGTTTTDGTISAAYYLGDSTTPVEAAYTGTGVNAGTAALTDFRWGKLTGAGDLVAYFDDMAADDGATAFIPPVGTATPLSASLAVSPTSGTVPFSVTATASTSGGSGAAKTYAFNWGDGATTAAQASPTATHQYTTAGSFTVTTTVTEA